MASLCLAGQRRHKCVTALTDDAAASTPPFAHAAPAVEGDPERPFSLAAGKAKRTLPAPHGETCQGTA